MKSFELKIALIIAALIGAGFAAEPPHIGYIYPAGGRQGTVIDIIAGGKNIKEATAVHITGMKVLGQVLEDPDKDLVATQAEDKKFEEISVIQKKVEKESLKPENFEFERGTTEKRKARAEREKRRNNKKNKKKDDPFPDTVKLRVAILDDAEPGDRELRVITSAGLSNKFTFQVSQLQEVYEIETNNRREPVRIASLPAVLNGQICGIGGTQWDTDLFSFTAVKGQELVIKADIRSLLPYIADGVPGWFQGTLALYDKKGNELAHSDNFRFSQDPVLFYRVPENGDYILEVRDSIYRAREDFVYRVSIGALPFITHIYPLGSRFNTPTVVSIYGKNLPVNSLEVVNKDINLPVQFIRLETKEGLSSNKVMFGLGGLPETNENDGNVSMEKAQLLTLPVTVNGRINTAGEKDFYSFPAKAGQIMSVEVTARSLGSPLDSYIILTNGRGEKIVDNDDDLTYKGEGISTHHADSALSVKIPADGLYILQIKDVQGKGGEEYAYRLRLSEPLPDFEVHTYPPNLTLPRGGTAYFKAKVIRKDGFTGPVQLSLVNSSNGLKLDSSVIPEGKTEMNFTVSATFDVREGISICNMEATGVAQGKKNVWPVTPTEEYMQAFAWMHRVPVSAQILLITEPRPFTLSFGVPRGQIFELTQGKETKIPLDTVRNGNFKENLQLQLLDAPPGIILRSSSLRVGRDKQSTTIRVESKVVPGMYENLVLIGVANVPVPDLENPENKNKREKIFVTAPALPIVVLKGKGEKKPVEKPVLKSPAETTPERKVLEPKKVREITPEKSIPGKPVIEKKGVTGEAR